MIWKTAQSLMSEPLKIQQIRQFVITASSGSFLAAARGTFRSQAAVSAAMRDLERQVGDRLFEKSGRAKLTPLAQTLYPMFQELLATHDRTVADIRQIVKAELGSISLAVVPFLSEKWLPRILVEFNKKYPDVKIRVTDQRSLQIRALVADGTVNIGVAALLAEDDKLTIRPVATDAFGVLCSQEHPIARSRRGVPWSILRGEQLIGNAVFELLKGNGLGKWIEEPEMMITSRTTIMECVRAGLGITAIPTMTQPMKMDGLAFVPLVRPRITRTIGVVTRRGQTLLPAAAALNDWVYRSLTEYARSKGATFVADRIGTGQKKKRR